MAHAVTLAIGFMSLKSPEEPIGDPMFSILEVLIIVMMPVMVALMVAVHAWAPSHAKSLSLIAVMFMSLLASVTCGLHFVIVAVSRQAAFAYHAWRYDVSGACVRIPLWRSESPANPGGKIR